MSREKHTAFELLSPDQILGHQNQPNLFTSLTEHTSLGGFGPVPATTGQIKPTGPRNNRTVIAAQHDDAITYEKDEFGPAEVLHVLALLSDPCRVYPAVA